MRRKRVDVCLLLAWALAGCATPADITGSASMLSDLAKKNHQDDMAEHAETQKAIGKVDASIAPLLTDTQKEEVRKIAEQLAAERAKLLEAQLTQVEQRHDAALTSYKNEVAERWEPLRKVAGVADQLVERVTHGFIKSDEIAGLVDHFVGTQTFRDSIDNKVSAGIERSTNDGRLLTRNSATELFDSRLASPVAAGALAGSGFVKDDAIRDMRVAADEWRSTKSQVAGLDERLTQTDKKAASIPGDGALYGLPAGVAALAALLTRLGPSRSKEEVQRLTKTVSDLSAAAGGADGMKDLWNQLDDLRVAAGGKEGLNEIWNTMVASGVMRPNPRKGPSGKTET